MLNPINKEIDIAVRVLIFMSKRNELITVTELSKTLGLPRPFLRKILQVLARNNILTSKKGKGGGFLLKKYPENIFLIDIINIFQKGFEFLNCVDNKGKACNEINKCKLKNKLIEIEYTMKKDLAATSLIDLIY